MSIYQKIRKASLLKKTAIEAAQAGAQGTGIDFNKEDGDGPKKVANPVTYKSSALRKNGNGDDELVSYKGKKYTLQQLKEIKAAENNNPPELKAATGPYSEMTPGYKKFIEGLIGKGHTAQQLIDGDYLDEKGTSAFTFPGLSSSPGSETISSNITPVMETEIIRPSQRYNMGEKEVEDANTARGRMRRGLNREERKGMKDIVKGLDPKQRQEFRDNMKKQRNVDLDGDGKVSLKEKLKSTFGGSRQQKKLNALNAVGGGEIVDGSVTKQGSVGEEFGLKSKTIRQDVAKAAQGNYEFDPESQRDLKIRDASQNKYGSEIGKTFDYRPGSTNTSHADADGSERVITDEDLETKTTTLTKKGRLGKNAKAFKNKAGRGAGY